MPHVTTDGAFWMIDYVSRHSVRQERNHAILRTLQPDVSLRRPDPEHDHIASILSHEMGSASFDDDV